jgi:uncharacterized protein
MLPSITKLLQLQERDLRLRNLQRDLKEVPNLQARARTQLSDDQGAVDAATLKMREIEVKIKNLELDAQIRRNTVQRLHQQQFETRKNDEFQALGNEVVRYQKEVSAFEDKQIEQMEFLETAKAELVVAQAKLAITQGHVDDELRQLAERAINLQARITELKTERQTLVAPIDEDLLENYERLLKTKNGTALVVAAAGVCGGCHMKLVHATVVDLKADDRIVNCEQCGRILYFA